MDASIEATVKAWQDNVTDSDLAAELAELVKDGNEDKLFDAFYRDLAFGTAGLRGTLGVGTNRMNVYVVAQATQGVADYLNAHYENPTLALARDSRNKGEDFQKRRRWRACRQWHPRLRVPAHRARPHAVLCGAPPRHLCGHRAHGLPQPGAL